MSENSEKNVFLLREMPKDFPAKPPISGRHLLDQANYCWNMAYISDIKATHFCYTLLPRPSPSSSYLDLCGEEVHVSKKEWEELA